MSISKLGFLDVFTDKTGNSYTLVDIFVTDDKSKAQVILENNRDHSRFIIEGNIQKGGCKLKNANKTLCLEIYVQINDDKVQLFTFVNDFKSGTLAKF